jgi:orotate phosphoribosyltransferase
MPGLLQIFWGGKIMKTQIALHLLQIQAVFLRPDEPFTWASGIQSPIYCDNRLTLSDPAVRLDVENGLAELVKTHFPQAEILMGTSTAGIAHAAIAAHLLNLPMGYVRGSAKDHGRQNRIEGKLLPGQKAVVVEDLISTGGSVLEVVESLREAGAEVLGIVSIFTYGMEKAKKRLAEANVVNVSLTDFDTVVSVAIESGYIRQNDKAKLMAFRDNPEDESWRNR